MIEILCLDNSQITFLKNKQMTKKALLIEQVKTMPDEWVDDFLHLIEKLSATEKDIVQTHLASEAVLAEDWLSEDEIELWKDL